MKILFAIQGTGNGHLSRARDIYPELAKYGEVDVLVSGIQADVTLPFPIKYQFHGMSFIFGKSGGVDLWKTAKSLKLGTLIKDVKKLDVKSYDLVINDFEPVSAWACKRRKVPCIALSHQSAVLNPRAPKGKHDWKGIFILKHYAPYTAAYGFHFKAYPPNIFTPVIRKEIRDIKPTNEGHYTVYLPAYDDQSIVRHLSVFRSIKWQVFSKHNKAPFTEGNITVQPINNEAFIKSMASCTGLLCNAGFEGPAEAMYLGKKVLVVPMIGQYEQQCNAAGAVGVGATSVKYLGRKYYERVKWWLMTENGIKADFPDMTADIIATLMREHAGIELTEKGKTAAL